ncbi:uncharacterized protein Z518_09255 [Rhinocladiella mackenziei CBS 650.93]|uniref:Rhinocladiella mackenziei CBS 650.93 unplaced genomic scaffold supercont1.7, whole genome shotgun sequence n=1 Tax=Rhinocladiella mackenziei CBS 650.93 TaxID=1442369 RepID=A0A0D2I6V3_9EURO|nr:uncharacterized protein Z518_09255 [Rhinocladiella mackenziei CBS 650.93]KIX01529.1 hypothetical protein Z518_09255 [Rhinocladiella mackenziei CBS 650.93]
MAEREETTYQPQDALAASTRAALLTGAAGLFLAAVQNTVAKENIGAFGVFSRFGRTIGFFTATGGTFQFTRSVSANLRETRDFINDGIGGACAGAIVGLAKRSMTSTLGGAFALGVAAAAVSYTGGSMFESADSVPQPDRTAYKEEAKARYRRPINEVINELGEGRGIYGPGYEERRKQRIKEKYGIEIQEPYYKGTSAS